MAVEAQESLAIHVNGDAVETRAAMLDDLIVELGLAGTRTATARNGEFVPERARAVTRLVPGDRIEILSPRHGG